MVTMETAPIKVLHYYYYYVVEDRTGLQEVLGVWSASPQSQRAVGLMLIHLGWKEIVKLFYFPL